MPAVMAGFIFATVANISIAEAAGTAVKSPDQVEQALSALLDKRTDNVDGALVAQVPTTYKKDAAIAPKASDKPDHSEKSVAELIMAGLAITNEAKSELAAEEKSSHNDATVAKNTDFQVEDIKTEDELAALNHESAEEADDALEQAEVEIVAELEEPTESTDIIVVEADETLEQTEDEIVTELEESTQSKEVLIAEADEALEQTEDEFVAELEESTQSSEVLIAEADEVIEQAEDNVGAELDESAQNSEVLIAEADEALEKTEQALVADAQETVVKAEAVVVAEVAETAEKADELVVAKVPAAKDSEKSELPALPKVAAPSEVPVLPAIAKAVDKPTSEEGTSPPALTTNEASSDDNYSMIAVSESAEEGNIEDLTNDSAASYTASESSETVNSQEATVADELGAKVEVAVRAAGCPETFNQVDIPVNGKLCQIFAADYPASMILFIPQTPEEVVEYYLSSSDQFAEPKTVKQRTMIKSADNNTTLIISKDGGGTQVDILVKAPLS